MKQIFKIAVLLFLSANTIAQNNCVVDYSQTNSAISYNQHKVDSILHLGNYDAFFYGESHTTDFEPQFKFQFIKHLNMQYGVRDVFIEVGYAAAYFFNQFLKSGDTSILKNNRLPYQWGKYPDFWRNLYQYNAALPDSSKIVIHGIDFERPEVFKLLIKTKNPSIPIPPHLQEIVAQIEALSANKELIFTDKEFKNTFSKLTSIFQAHEDDFRNLYGVNFDIVRKTLTNKTPIVFSVNPRNKVWINNVQEILIDQKIKKMVGFFGSAHTRYNNASSLTIALQEAGLFKGRVLNIAAMYTYFKSAGGADKIIAYDYKEKEIFETYYDPACRGMIIKSSLIPKVSSKTASDYILLAREIVEK